MKLAIGCDHTGIELKQELISLISNDHEVVNVGTDSDDAVDYPDIAQRVASAVTSSEVDRGILICGTGIGMAMAAGKFSGVRAATCNDSYVAEMSRRHNDANILCLGARVIGVGMARTIVKKWLTTEFDKGRHQRRVDKIDR